MWCYVSASFLERTHTFSQTTSRIWYPIFGILFRLFSHCLHFIMRIHRPVGPTVRRLTTDQEIPGSNPGQDYYLLFYHLGRPLSFCCVVFMNRNIYFHYIVDRERMKKKLDYAF